MENVIALGGLAAVLAISMSLALGMQWLGLRSVFHFIPGPRVAQAGPEQSQRVKRPAVALKCRALRRGKSYR